MLRQSSSSHCLAIQIEEWFRSTAIRLRSTVQFRFFKLDRQLPDLPAQPIGQLLLPLSLIRPAAPKHLGQRVQRLPFSLCDLVRVHLVPAQVCDSDPGDVVAFDYRTWHASCGGSTDRHMATFNFYRYPKTAEETAVTRFALNQNAAKTKRAAKPWNPKEPIPQSWLDDAENLPRRKRWIAHLQEVRHAECSLEVVQEGIGVRLLPSHR